ncbi:transcriptional regulator, TetR family [Clostridiales bacterium oral taxon 876 str. F0540]|nr:transcriptional regulator, TetR family [Clostridiales bacterium oral taxon 876 str. F0540]
MGIKERKEREREEKKELILSAAKKIIEEEGIQALSIRKIASRIEYSPAIIYHYFQDKSEIVDYFLREGYKEIVSALGGLQHQEGEPDIVLKASLVNFIEAALKMSEEYKSVMLNDSEEVLKHTSVLFRGASDERPAVGLLCKYLKQHYFKDREDSFIELTAQILWSSIFGLIIRLILEKNVDEVQKHRLIEHNIRFIINGIKTVK